MKYAELINFLPLTAFMLTARFGGMDDLAWRNAFIIGGVCTVLVIAFHLYKKMMFDRLMLGINLFLLVGASAFVTETFSILYYLGRYKGPAFLLCIFCVGVVTTVCSQAGFIGVVTNDKRKLQKASVQLLVLTLVAIIWSLMTNESGLIFSAVIPFVAIRVVYDRLRRQLSGE